jgi:hypothetical protein
MQSLVSDFDGERWVAEQNSETKQLFKMYLYRQDSEKQTFFTSLSTDLKRSVQSGQNSPDQLVYIIISHLHSFFSFKNSYKKERKLSIHGIVRIVFSVLPPSKELRDQIEILLAKNFGSDPRFTLTTLNETLLFSTGVDPYNVVLNLPDGIPKIPAELSPVPRKRQLILQEPKVLSPQPTPTTTEPPKTVKPVRKSLPPPVLVKSQNNVRVSLPGFYTPQNDDESSTMIEDLVTTMTIRQPKDQQMNTVKLEQKDQQESTFSRSEVKSDVEEWLKGLTFSRYFPMFKRMGFFTFDDLKKQVFTLELLRSMGIESLFCQRVILEEIEVKQASLNTVEKWLAFYKWGYLIEKAREMGITDVDVLNRLGRARVFSMLTNDGNK